MLYINLIKVFAIVLFFLLFGCGSKCNQPVVAYLPLEFDGNCFVLKQSKLTKEHFDRVEKVLTFYTIEYVRKDNTSIEFKEKQLPEMIYNFGSKAENKKWLGDRSL